MQTQQSATDPAVHIIDSALVPAPGRYEIDPVHTFLSFGTRHLRIGLVRGRFTALRGSITVYEDPGRTQIELTVNTQSVDTHHEARDQDLRSARFFDVEAFPIMTYSSSAAAYDGDGTWEIDGQLTIRDMTRPVRLEARFRGTTIDTGGHIRAGFHAAARLRRQDFNLIADLAREVGALGIGTDIDVEADVEATLRN
jgi:polyisoprenoid-binding protein YceI